MAVADDILAFSAARDPWQRDLLRRIYTQPVLTPADLDEVLDMVKAQARVINSAAAEKPDPLTDEHMLHRTSAEPPTVLASIGAVANANQLAANQVLPFAVNGLTVVYGGNGSGKTGYTRLLKGACRARRERPERVLSNIYNVGKPAGPAEATIRYVVGDGPVQEDRWRDGDPPPAALSRISVFDVVTAPLYADKQHEIEYLPFGLDVLPRLAKACEDLSARIDAEIRPLEQQTVNQIAIAVPPDAKAAALLELLVAATPPDKLPDVETIHSLAAWDHTLTAELNDVEEQLKNDPALIAAACRRAQAAVGSAAERMAAIDAALGHDAIKALAELIIRLKPLGPQQILLRASSSNQNRW